MKVWTVITVWDEGASDDVLVFSSKDKVYNYLFKELTRIFEQEKEFKPEFIEDLNLKFQHYIEAMNETFSHDYTTFSINSMYNSWSVCQTEIDAEN